MQKRKIIIIVPLVLGIMLSAFIVLKPQAQDKTESQKKIETQKSSFPSINYTSEEALSQERKETSKKYDTSLTTLIPTLFEDEVSILTHDWARNLEALPVDKSELIVLGTVVNVSAHLSNKKNTVYSEIKIEIEEIFKNNSEKKLNNGEFVKAEREGGIVKFPSGYEQWHSIDGQQMPLVDGKYIFFLTHDFQLYGIDKQSFYLLSGYKLKETKVIPLDNPGDFYPIVSVYKGTKKSILLSDLRKALQK